VFDLNLYFYKFILNFTIIIAIYKFMRILLTIFALLTIEKCFSQELDIIQNDSLYFKNKVTMRTMYSINGSDLQKELVTFYNQIGQKTKQFWYRNGEKDFHNVETFYYSNKGNLTSIIDSNQDGVIEITTINYDKKNNLLNRITLNKNDTIDFQIYPNQKTLIKCWYMGGKPYRVDTTIYETTSAEIEYFGLDKLHDCNKPFKWHYYYKNEFDKKGNLIKASGKLQKPFKSFGEYMYNKKGLLINKQTIIYNGNKSKTRMQYYFTYE
jgi:hypothetical protein